MTLTLLLSATVAADVVSVNCFCFENSRNASFPRRSWTAFRRSKSF